jgi:MFS transporter, FHS family, glucose/mannose:H+ symporter
MAFGASSSRALPANSSGTFLIHLDFLLTGIVMTFLGPMLPILAARWQINDATSGRLFLAQFVSSMFGMLMSAPLVQRLGYRVTFAIGLLMMASGMALLATGPFWLGMVSISVLGVGFGITTPAGNLRTAEVNPSRSASALNVINAVWGLGAVSPPFLLEIARHLGRPSWFLYGTAGLLLALLLAFTLTRFEHDTHQVENPATSKAADFRVSPLVILISALFFIYVGTENAFGQWVATYAHRLDPGAHNWWTLMPAFFYGAMLAGRSLAPVVLKFLRETRVAKIGLVLAVLGGIALLRAHGIGLTVMGSLCAGLGLASIFPISVSLLPSWFGEKTQRASGPVFASGNLGGAVLPWVVGVVSTSSGSLRVAFLVPLAGAASMLAFYVLNRSSSSSAAAIAP